MYVQPIRDLNEITSHMLGVLNSQFDLHGKVMGGPGERPVVIIVIMIILMIINDNSSSLKKEL